MHAVFEGGLNPVSCQDLIVLICGLQYLLAFHGALANPKYEIGILDLGLIV
jgi:hypothetical protein